MTRLLLLVLGAALLVVSLVISLLEVASGVQPWGQTLLDNFLLARALPFVLGFGIVTGLFRAGLARHEGERRASDGALRRFLPSTVALHWLAGLAVLIGLATGTWQYLKGLLDVPSPVPMPGVYRLHYVAAVVLVFALGVFVTDWWIRNETALGVPKGQRARALRGLAHELPRWLGGTLAYLLGLNMRRAAPPTEQFTYYERGVSFPTWVIALTLITVTGILKAMRYVYPIPGDVLYWVSAIHVGAMVLLALKLLDHVRYVIAPSRWPLMGSMVTGWLSAKYAQAFHPGWQPRPAQSTAEQPREAPASPGPAVTPAGGGAA